jgi:hypothetical protein
MRSRVLLWGFLVGLVVGGCAGATGYKFTGEGGPYAKRTEVDKIEVFDTANPPGKPFVRIGRIDGGYTSNTVVLQLTDVLPQLRKYASEAGGDAIVVRQAGYEGGPNPAKPFNVIADVIRWQP